jgi:hypothetical protein
MVYDLHGLLPKPDYFVRLGTVPLGDFVFAVPVVSGPFHVGPSVNRAMSGGCREDQDYQQSFHVSLRAPLLRAQMHIRCCFTAEAALLLSSDSANL